MADWWLGACDHPVHAVQLVGGDPPLIAVWLTRRSVQFYDLFSGALYDSWTVVPPAETDPDGETWRAFLESLRAPNGVYLPVVDAGVVIYSSHDGRVTLYHDREHGLTLAIDGDRFRLRNDSVPVLAVDFDRELATVAALCADGALYLFQQNVFVGAYPLDVRLDDAPSLVLLPDSAGIVIVAAGDTLLVCDTAGQVLERRAVPFAGRAVSCSPDGGLIALADRDQGLIRVYDADLHLTHQGSAWDVLQQADARQLLAGFPAADAVPEALAVDDDGFLVFAVDGVLCRTHRDALTPLPQPRALL